MVVRPLSSYRILDFGTNIACPMACQFLADMGAEVIKIETRKKLDGLREGRPIIGEDTAGGDEGLWPDLQPAFHAINRNKLSVTVDMKKPSGLALVRGLIAQSDIVMDNFSPGVMKRAGLDYQIMKNVRPDIIMISMPIAGDSGPLSNMIGYAHSTVGVCGLSSLMGYADEFIGQSQAPYCDMVTAQYAATVVLAALRHRQATGEGQYIELAQLEANVTMIGEAILDYSMNRRVMRPQGNAHPTMAPHNNYRCLGEDKWVSIAIDTEDEWRAFCKAMGDPDWTKEERFADKYERLLNRAALDELVSQWTVNYAPCEVAETLQTVGVAAVPVMNIEDQFLDPHFRERQIHLETDHPAVGAEVIYGIPWKISGVPLENPRHAPLLGEHTEQVFGELLGVTEGDLASMRAEDVLS